MTKARLVRPRSFVKSPTRSKLVAGPVDRKLLSPERLLRLAPPVRVRRKAFRVFHLHDVVTKTDLTRPEQVAERLTQLTSLMEFADVVPCSAVDGFQVGLLADLLVARLPDGPPLYPDGELTDEPEETLVAELVREAALEGVRDELPHSIAVVVQEMIRGRVAPKVLRPCSTCTRPSTSNGRARRAS